MGIRSIRTLLGKSFNSSISPWIVTLDALEPFRIAGEKQEPEVLDYLKFNGNKNFDVELEVQIKCSNLTQQLFLSQISNICIGIWLNN